MKKITKKQNEIFKAHKKAWLEDNFDFVATTKKELLANLSEGKTFQKLWEYAVDNHVSITSQIAMSHKVLSKKAESDLRACFKRILNGFKIQ